MEEREALKRQIELLQTTDSDSHDAPQRDTGKHSTYLINKHKSVHGDAPFSIAGERHQDAPTSARGRGDGTYVGGRQYAPQIRESWRETYSLRNKNPQSSGGHPSVSTSSSVDQFSSHGSSRNISLPSHSRVHQSDGLKRATLSEGITQQRKDEHIRSITNMREDGTKKTSADTSCKRGKQAAVSLHSSGNEGANLMDGTPQHERHYRQTQEFQQKPESTSVVLLGNQVTGSLKVPPSVKANSSASLLSSSQVHVKPSQMSKTITEPKQTTAPILKSGKTTLLPPALSKVSKQPSLSLPSQISQVQVEAPFLKKSKFTWVKSQNMGGVDPSHSSSSSFSLTKAVTVASVSKPEVASGSSPSFAISKRTPSKKLLRKLSPVAVALKTSKYRWVSSSADQAKMSRKTLLPKSLTPEKGEFTMKLKSSSTPSSKLKKGASPTLSSRYRWKAGTQTSSAAVTSATMARRRSAFHWTSDKSNKVMKGGLVSPSLPQRAPFPSNSPGGFKLRSRMKIIRKSASGCGAEKDGSPSAVKFSPRGRMHTSARSPLGVRRTPSKELVSFGRHKLRRLSTNFPRTSFSSPSQRSSTSPRVFRTRYKMVTRPSCSNPHALHYNPALSWRAKKIQSARSFLQNRLRTPHDRHPLSIQHLHRGSSMCWIRGSLYRVSANKLSRTVPSAMSINRTGRSSGPHVSSMIPALNRPCSSRHLASRAVQRSLAIIRHARQKKPQKQYCMYYNRFGKCNRGDSCPYIHDPDKVAVCTRFLRGTCKQADGTCPFSHKVAKEKMPVCSYFLKGICNNSDCPYSHVYVSRKAEVCEDFVKGYCPEGQKCKKKHTLVCPDFSKTGSCPRGARCKLQHRQRAKRDTSNTSAPPAKKTRIKEPFKRPSLSVVMPEGSQAATGTTTAGSLQLPSFISLSSSPEEADAPDMLPVETSQVKEKKLQIKPRL